MQFYYKKVLVTLSREINRETNTQHNKNCFVRKKTENAAVITRNRIFHTIKKKIINVQGCFYFFDITNAKKVI